MMKELLRDVDYAPLGSVGPLELEASLLFSAPFSGVEGEDLVVGRYEDVEVKFSEVVGYRLHEQARGLGGGQRAPSKQVLFRGLFFVAEFNKPARGQVVVYPDALEGALGPLATALQPRRDPGRLVLAEFRRKVGAPVAFSVVYGKLYMAVASHKNLLEPPLFGPMTSPKVFRGYLEDVGLFLALVEELGLNRKIWGEGTWH